MTENEQVLSGDVFIGPVGTMPGDGGWTHIGETDGPIRLEVPELAQDGDWETLRLPGPVSVTITVDATGYLAELYRAIHQIDLLANPRKHGHCRTCRPEQDRRPLAVDGRKYHRRQLARQRRRRHGH